jgi:diguanylate cyclase (GGDEF)-like protein
VSAKTSFGLRAGILVAIVVTFLGGGLFIRTSVATTFDANVEIHDSRTLLFRMLKAQLDEETGVRGFEATRDRQFLQPYVAARHRIKDASGPLEGMLSNLHLPVAARAAADAERINELWLRSVATPLVAGQFRDGIEGQRRGKDLVDRFRVDTRLIGRALLGRFDGVRHDADAALSRINVLILSTAVLLILAAMEFCALQRRVLESRERERLEGAASGERARIVALAHEAETRTAQSVHEESSQTQRTHAEALLHHAEYHDSLTGLPNRAFFLDRLGESTAHVRREAARVAVLFLNVDRFKIVNDSLGHAGGDQLLAALAFRLKSCLRPRDLLARLGGDEFAILLDNGTTEREACRLAARILEKLLDPFRIDSQDVLSALSIGIAVGQLGSEEAVEMLRDADIAMFRAKQAGGARFELFVHDMHVQAMARSQLEMDLRRALARGELRLAYQPIVSLRSGRVKGFEALVRWLHPHRGMIPPSTFIPLAEETGLIVALGSWVLGEACRQARTWQDVRPDGPSVSVNVNVAAKQLIGKDFAVDGFGADVSRVLDETQLDPACLNLEITESALLDYAAETKDALGFVRSLGVAMQLDDFGTGYSSLSYLQRLPIDTVKIDLSFISGGRGAGISNPQIVETILALAQKLDKRVTAEGVETKEQLDQLRALGCTSAQGFYISVPLDAAAALAFLTHWEPIAGYDVLPLVGA